jgi:hypothetical protein
MADLLQQLIDSMNSPASADTQEAAPTGQAGLQPFFNTPMYQLMFGENANQIDPTQRFRADPGFEFNQEQTARALQQYGAAKGLLESGPLQQELQKQLQGNQNNMYQTWLGQQVGQYDKYQNMLQGLTQFGAATNGAADANANGNLLAQLLSGNEMTAGQGNAAANLGVGDNISSLLANQGVMNANLYSNTGAAQANALMQAFGMNQQMQNNQAASNAGTMSSFLQGLGALKGASSAGAGQATWQPTFSNPGNSYAASFGQYRF